jgi:hypothetical protein
LALAGSATSRQTRTTVSLRTAAWVTWLSPYMPVKQAPPSTEIICPDTKSDSAEHR